jgi:hypothetical protein
MVLAEDDEMIEAFPLDREDPALGVSVQVGAAGPTLTTSLWSLPHQSTTIGIVIIRTAHGVAKVA